MKRVELRDLVRKLPTEPTINGDAAWTTPPLQNLPGAEGVFSPEQLITRFLQAFAGIYHDIAYREDHGVFVYTTSILKDWSAVEARFRELTKECMSSPTQFASLVKSCTSVQNKDVRQFLRLAIHVTVAS